MEDNMNLEQALERLAELEQANRELEAAYQELVDQLWVERDRAKGLASEETSSIDLGHEHFDRAAMDEFFEQLAS
jgi:hypothetical protein